MNEQTAERVKKGIVDPAVGPESIALILTHTCNLRCIYCRGGMAIEKRDPGEELTTKELFGLFEDAVAAGVREVNLGGMIGEPFCKRDILKIMRRIKQLGLVGSMTTNGSFLNARMAKELSRMGWDIMHLSLDFPGPDIQHALRPAATKKPYFKGIVEFLETLQIINSSLGVLINMVITKANFRELPRMAEFAAFYKNIATVNILRLIGRGFSAFDDLKLSDEDHREFRDILSRLPHKEKISFTGDWEEIRKSAGAAPAGLVSEGGERKGRCFTNYYVLSIDANGDVLYCPQQHKTIGGLNIRKAPLRQWWGREHMLFRKALMEEAPCFEGCCTILKEQNKMIAEKVLGSIHTHAKA